VRWLEIIELRKADGGEGMLDELLRSLRGSPWGTVPRNAGSNLSPLNAAVEQRSITSNGVKIYRHAALETDLSVHLHWESERPERNGSALGLRLAQAFKEFGLVHHSIWVEKKE